MSNVVPIAPNGQGFVGGTRLTARKMVQRAEAMRISVYGSPNLSIIDDNAELPGKLGSDICMT